ncbi:MAG: signal peptide peptidase SppA [Bacteroidales bacterium]|nr:signal peptide peptidase SppA [Bacteroidales bacterium]
MKSFIKFTLAVVAGIIITSMLFFVFLIAGLSSLVSSGGKPVTIGPNSVLVLNAGVEIPDRGNDSPWAGINFAEMTYTPVVGLNDILNNIRMASEDDNIKGILIENGINSSGWAVSGEIREAISEFRKSGKFVVSYTDYLLTQQCYYLSSAADMIFINPGAMVEFKGLSSEVVFFKNALEKLGIEVQVTRHGKFKGAVEPFMLNRLSEENREQITSYTGSIWKHIVENISESRGITAERLNLIADNLSGSISSEALKQNLVDGLMFRDQLTDTLRMLAGSGDREPDLVSMAKYSKAQKPRSVFSTDRISVIYAAGNIVAGKGNETSIGGKNYAEIIKKERLDTSVKAIVLRINSPGGESISSEMIWRELWLARQVKPVVVSMGNYAASGGYYIACPATKIYSNPETLSGSIGVFGLLPNLSGLFEKKLGLAVETVNTNRNADFPSVFRPMNSYEKDVMLMSIEQVYGDFTEKVAQGRNMSVAQVDNIGQGRVWSGISAMEIGLVDELGGLYEAIQGAAMLAGTESYEVKELPGHEDSYARLMEQLSGDIMMKKMKKELGETAVYLDWLNGVRELSGIQARLPFFINVR